MPHGYCLRWNFWLLLTHVGADVIIALSYFSIPAALMVFVQKRKDNITFGFLFWLFSLFIFSCGVTHIFEIYVLWHPVYWAEGWAKVVTAIASFTTAIWLWKTIPVALRIPTAQDLMAANEELRRAMEEREEVQRSSRQKDNFMATLSHELRTPLNAILGWTQLLQSNRMPPDKIAEAVEIIRRNAQAQAQLIDDLLDLSRIASGKMRLETNSVTLVNAIEMAITALKPTAEAKRITLSKEYPQEDIAVAGDAQRIQQIILNLLNNALKFTPEEGQVTISLTCLQTEKAAEIRISDTGKGIAPGFLPHIFDRFRQADDSFSRMEGGLGIGLALVKELTILHGGSVRAESAGEGCGSTFIVTLPVDSQAEAPLTKNEKQGAPLTSFSGYVFLIIDDDPDSRLLLAELFKSSGATVILVGSAIEAMEYITDMSPDIILCDIAMPEHDGIWLIRQVRSLSDGDKKNIPAIAVTALAHENERALILEMGFDVHLPKPINTEDVLLTVENLIRSKKKSKNPASMG